MKIRNIILIGLSAAMLALPSCKKDKDSTSTKDYVSGTLTFSSSGKPERSTEKEVSYSL